MNILHLVHHCVHKLHHGRMLLRTCSLSPLRLHNLVSVLKYLMKLHERYRNNVFVCIYIQCRIIILRGKNLTFLFFFQRIDNVWNILYAIQLLNKTVVYFTYVNGT